MFTRSGLLFCASTFLLVFGFLQQEAHQLNQLRLIGQPEKAGAEFVGASITDANNRICAAIKVISDMEGFTYDSYNRVVKVDDQPGQDMVYLSPDERVLEIFHTGFAPLKLFLAEIGISLAERQVWIIRLAGDIKTGEVEVAILTNPAGAELTIDGQSKGSAERHKVTIGNHEIKLIKPGYQQILKNEYMDEQHTFFKYDLLAQQDVNIRIDTEPPDAAVFIDGMRLGQSPVSNFYIAGRYKLRIEKENYVPYEDFIDIQPPRVKKNFVLQPDFGDLTVISAPESGLPIFINGVKQNVVTPHTFMAYKAGIYRVAAQSEYFECSEQAVTVERGKAQSVTLSSEAIFALLTITAPAGATVYLNDKKLDNWKNIRLAPSIVLLRGEMAKASPVEQRVALRRGEVRTVDLPLRVPTATVLVTAVPE